MPTHALIRAVGMLVLASVCVRAQTVRYVQAGGIPPGNGTLAAPFTSIQAGIAASLSGDSLSVLPGVYYEELDFLGKDVDVASTAGAAQTTVFADGIQTPVVRFHNGEGPGARLAGFTLRNGADDDGDFAAGISVGMSSPVVEDCVVVLCQSFYVGVGGVGCVGGAPQFRRCTIQANYASNFQGPGVGGVHMQSPNGRFENCIITGNQGAYGYSDCVGSCCSGSNGGTGGVEGFGPPDAGAATHFQFIGCVIAGNFGGDGTYGGRGGHGGVVGSMTFANCTIVDNLGGSGADALIEPKCAYVAGNGGSGGVGDGAVLRNCIVRGNQGGAGGSAYSGSFGMLPAGLVGAGDDFGVGSVAYSNIPGFHAGPGNIDVDPQLANYRPTATSPGIDAGTNAVLGLPVTDPDGAPRIRHMVADQGAFESPLTTCRGAVGLATGAPIPVLTVDGADRVATVAPNAPATIAMAAPPGGGPAPFLIFGRIGAPSASELIELPAGIGEICFAHPFLAPSDPFLFVLADNILGWPAMTASTPAPWSTVLAAPGASFSFFLQGVLHDPSSSAGCSVTNAVRVDVQP